jgi:phage head maturation protease
MNQKHSSNSSTSTKKKEQRLSQPHKIEIRANADGTRTISGYAVVFNSLSLDLGSFKERVRPGAFAKSLANGPDVLCLYSHDDKQILGRRSSGTLELSKD